MSETWNHIIIGAGSAGCVLANRLSEDPGSRVLLLEAGGDDSYIWVKIPVGYLYCIGNPRTDWGFKTRAEPGLNGRAIGYPRGRLLGGCRTVGTVVQSHYVELCNRSCCLPLICLCSESV